MLAVFGTNRVTPDHNGTVTAKRPDSEEHTFHALQDPRVLCVQLKHGHQLLSQYIY